MIRPPGLADAIDGQRGREESLVFLCVQRKHRWKEPSTKASKISVCDRMVSDNSRRNDSLY